jgi:dTDP-4-amino-4,6-dideoxygalactose transaminase
MGEDFVGHLAVIVSETRDLDRDRLANEGVQTAIHYPVTDHRQAAWTDLARASLETTEFLADRIFTVPCFPEMTEDEISLVAEQLAAL